MTTRKGSKSCSKGHLEALASEITSLIQHATPAAKSSSPPTTCWSTNSEDMGVALTVMSAAGSSIHDGVTRFNLVYKANPGEAASASMAKEMGGFCQQMVSSLTLLSSVGASKSMVTYFSAGIRAILHSLKDLVEALLDPSRHSQVNSLTGVVWQGCKELQQAPKSNKLACRRQMMQWSVAMKDTIDEFQEAAKTSAAANADKPDAPEGTQALGDQLSGLSMGGDGEGAGAEDDFDFDDMDEEYSPAELQCVTASIDVLRAFRRCLKAANDTLNTLDSAKPTTAQVPAAQAPAAQAPAAEVPGSDSGVADKSKRADDTLNTLDPAKAPSVQAPGGDGAAEGAVWLEGRLQWAQAVQACLEEAHECAGDLGIQLYPPLDGSELSGCADDLGRKLTSFCDVFYTRGQEAGVEVGEEKSPIRALVEEKLGVLRTGLAQL